MSKDEKELVLNHLKNSYYKQSDSDYSAELFESAVKVILESPKTCSYILDRLRRGKTRGDVLLYKCYALSA